MSQEAKDILLKSVHKIVDTKEISELKDILYRLIGILSVDGGIMLCAVASDLDNVNEDQLKYIKAAINFVEEADRECAELIKIYQGRN